MLGTSYRHLNRVIQQFFQEGLIERYKGFILVEHMQPWYWFSGMIGVGVVVCLVQGSGNLDG